MATDKWQNTAHTDIVFVCAQVNCGPTITVTHGAFLNADGAASVQSLHYSELVGIFLYWLKGIYLASLAQRAQRVSSDVAHVGADIDENVTVPQELSDLANEQIAVQSHVHPPQHSDSEVVDGEADSAKGPYGRMPSPESMVPAQAKIVRRLNYQGRSEGRYQDKVLQEPSESHLCPRFYPAI